MHILDRMAQEAIKLRADIECEEENDLRPPDLISDDIDLGYTDEEWEAMIDLEKQELERLERPLNQLFYDLNQSEPA